MNDISLPEDELIDGKSERAIQIEKLQEENSEIIGWLEIDGTDINYPVLQGSDNSFYMTHNYKKEYSKDGSIFLDKDYNWDKPSSNLLIYGHNNLNGNMFQNLLAYKKESYYKEHPQIKFTTKEENTFEIIAVFYSRVYYKKEKDVFRYYYFINAENEQEYDDFISNCKKVSIYEIGNTAHYGEQLLTLSTCEYSQEDGRFVVVAKKIK